MPETPDQPENAETLPDDERDDEARFRAKRIRARRVLLGALLFILIALGLYGILPWLLPASIHEGPMVQMAGEHEVTLVWYLTRPVGDELSVHIGDKQVYPVENSGRRCRAILTGLEPGETYPYTIMLGRRTLAHDEFRTNQPTGEPFNFIVFGDSGKATREQYMLAARMNAADPDFMLHVGDLIYSNGARRHFKNRFFTPYRELIRRVNFWPCIGNHEVDEELKVEAYLEVFDLPENGPAGQPAERHYWFDYASARIAVIDSETDEAALSDHVAPWLREVFSEAEMPWKFVVLHRPPYTAGAHAPCEKIQNTLVPVFESTGIDIVFSGHDHMYERMMPIRGGKPAENGDGVTYVVSGAGGALLYQPLPPEQRPAYLAALHNEIHSFTSVSVVSDDELILTQIALNGEILDRWTLYKTPKHYP